MKKSLLALACLSTSSLSVAQSQWDDSEWEDDWGEQQSQQFQITGFAELGLGYRFNSDRLIRQSTTLEELRVRLEGSYQYQDITFTAKTDLLANGLQDHTGATFRELSLSTPIGDNLNIKLGRQILTWGTGDLVFLNDMFAKDWQSFFSGREDSYLKAPSDALKLSGFFDLFNVDFVWTPEFDPDNFIRGEYFSLYNPYVNQQVAPGRQMPVVSESGDEFAVRIYRSFGKAEWALYGYQGYSKSPDSATITGQALHAKKYAYGASVLMPLGTGLFNAEVSWHQSKQDTEGTNPLIKNDQFRALVGYEQELVSRLTASFQLYLERTQDYSELLQYSFFPDYEVDKDRVLLTNRLTWRNTSDTITASLFTFYSPTDDDHYIRPSVTYRYSDQWQFVAGANLFGGENSHSFFGQFEDASNAYIRIRFNF